MVERGVSSMKCRRRKKYQAAKKLTMDSTATAPKPSQKCVVSAARTWNSRSPGSMASGEQRFDVHVLFLVGPELQQLGRMEAGLACHQHARELLYAGVIEVHALVVELASIGDGALQSRD